MEIQAPTSDRRALALAVELLDAVELESTGEYVYLADETGCCYLVAAGDLVDLGGALETDDDGNAYSLWCAWAGEPASAAECWEAGFEAAAVELAREEHDSRTWVADDGNAEVEYQTDTAREAAEEYVADGDWGDDQSSTTWVTIYVYPRYYVDGVGYDDNCPRTGRRDSYAIPIEPPEPPCVEGGDHHWVDGPDRCSGAGVAWTSTCDVCGLDRVVDTDATRPEDGSAGHTSTTYA